MRKYHPRFASFGSSTFQIVFMASLSWTTTPRAATSSRLKPTMPACSPECSELAPASMVSTALLPASPSIHLNSAERLPREASAPMSKPAIMVTMSGPIEKIE